MKRVWTTADKAQLCRLLDSDDDLATIGIRIDRTVGSIATTITNLRRDDIMMLPEQWRQPRHRSNGAGTPAIDHLPAPIVRDPCFRCGVRRDVGCIHAAHERAA